MVSDGRRTSVKIADSIEEVLIFLAVLLSPFGGFALIWLLLITGEWIYAKMPAWFKEWYEEFSG